MSAEIVCNLGGTDVRFRPFVVDDLPTARGAANAFLSAALRARARVSAMPGGENLADPAQLTDADFDAMDAANEAATKVLAKAVSLLRVARELCLDDEARGAAANLSATADEIITAALTVLRGNRLIEEAGASPAAGEGAAGTT